MKDKGCPADTPLPLKNKAVIGMQTILSFVIVLSILVFIHELGHFLFAKRAGILVREFAIGFGPKIFSRWKGETLYSIRALPLGGFVRMAGEDPEIVELQTGSKVAVELDDQDRVTGFFFPKHPKYQSLPVKGKVTGMDLEKDLFVRLETEDGRPLRYDVHPQAFLYRDQKDKTQIAPLDRQFSSKTLGQRALTILAGPVFNIVLAAVLFMVLVKLTGVESKVIHDVVPGSPAAEAGLKSGDVIRAVNGQSIRDGDDLREKVQQSQGQPMLVTVQRGDQVFQTKVKPIWNPQIKQYLMNVRLEQQPATATEVVVKGAKETVMWTDRIFEGFGQLITGKIGIQALGGPVQIASITGQAAEAGLLALIRWTALLSLYLGVFNLLPIPALDGSRLVFIGLEALRGKPVDPNKESMVHFVGFALLMVLMLAVTYNDIMKVFFSQR